jgi:hypothetical protein
MKIVHYASGGYHLRDQDVELIITKALAAGPKDKATLTAIVDEVERALVKALLYEILLADTDEYVIGWNGQEIVWRRADPPAGLQPWAPEGRA